MTDLRPTASADSGAAPTPAPYAPSELEVVARLLLQDERVRVLPGAWWSYYPERGEVIYPPNLLAEWPATQALGALCHEIAEVRYSGRPAIAVFERFAGWAQARGVSPDSAALLLNTINDLRVNQCYLAQFPGSRRYFQALYRQTSLVPKDDLRDQATPVAARPTVLPHHAYVDALTMRWAADLAEQPAQLVPDERVRRALARTWPAIARAIASPDLARLAEVVQREIFPTYQELLQASLNDLRRAASAEAPEEVPPPTDVDGEDEDAEGDAAFADDLSALVRGSPVDEGPTESWVILSDESTAAEAEADAAARTAPPPGAPPGDANRAPTPPGSRWSGGIVQRFRRLGRRGHGTPAYDDFSYIEAVRRLGPQIDSLLHGGPGREGLVAILNRRRFGTFDPWRRPRRRRRGDSGDIDPDHAENLLIAPAVAFLRGRRQLRDDSQKDFAHAILLDVSGSVVQRGYRSRKFDQLIDTLVVFCEIHQRLKLPYELIAFSDHVNVLRSFNECRYDNLQIDPSSAYVVKDFSYLVRDMYHADHGETHEVRALDQAVADLAQQRGLKTIFVVSDGISSDRPALTERLVDLEERNQVVPSREGLMVLAFGLGLAENEFNASYQPAIDDQPIQCSAGRLVPNLEALPTIVCDAVDRRIRTA
jgi:hypothetical protein